MAPDPPIVTAEQPGSTAVEKESSPSSSSGIEDASPKLSMLEELRRMREELRRIEEAGPVLSPMPSNTVQSTFSSEQQVSNVNNDIIYEGRQQDLVDDIELQRPKKDVDDGNYSNRNSHNSNTVTSTAATNAADTYLDDSKV